MSSHFGVSMEGLKMDTIESGKQRELMRSAHEEVTGTSTCYGRKTKDFTVRSVMPLQIKLFAKTY